MVASDKLKAYLSERAGAPVEINEFRQLSGGACQDNYLVAMSHGGSTALTNHETCVLRTDKGGALLGSPPPFARARIRGNRERAVAAGVLTPPVKWLSEDTSIVGHPFYLMQKIEGTANPREILKSKKSISKN
jgi:aminoglycoside phosphotransferase (APT) family kinase protein